MPRLFSEANLIAVFGSAKLMRKRNGDYYIIGGGPADHAAAKEWVSMFMHEASISFPPTLPSRAPAARSSSPRSASLSLTDHSTPATCH